MSEARSHGDVTPLGDKGEKFDPVAKLERQLEAEKQLRIDAERENAELKGLLEEVSPWQRRLQAHRIDTSDLATRIQATLKETP
jgi:hypothetical protein